MLTFDAKLEGFENVQKVLSSRLIAEVLKYTIQDVTKGARVAIKDKIQEGYNIKASDLNAAMKVKTTGDPLEQHIQIKDEDKRGITAFKLAGRVAVQTKEGTWIEIRKGRAKAFTQAFVSTMRSGHKGVFIRLRGGSGRGGRMTRRDVGGKNPPIHEIYGPRITSLVKDEVVTKTINDYLKANAQRIFNQKLNWKTGGLLGR